MGFYRNRLAAAAVLAALLLSGCRAGEDKPVMTKTVVALNTTVVLSIYDDDADEGLLEDCVREITRYENLFSRTLPGSDISRINAAGGEWVTVSSDTLALIRESVRVSEMCGGAFDITVEPLSSLWNFTGDHPRAPADAAIADAVAHIGCERINIQGDRVRLADPEAGIDLGGAAKGYIADRLREYLEENGVKSALINLGGNVLAIGGKNGGDFSIGIRDPAGDESLAATVRVQNRSVVTSGSYERGFTQGGVWYHHILDPSTGRPVNNGLASVTILSENSVLGDMLSTACFVLGRDKGMQLVEDIPEAEALFIDTEGGQYRSSGFPQAS